MKKIVIIATANITIFFSLSHCCFSQELIQSYSIDLAKEKRVELFAYQIEGHNTGIISLKSDTKGIYLIAQNENNTLKTFSANLADGKQVESFIEHSHDMTKLGKAYKKIPPIFIPVRDGIIGMHTNGSRKIMFSECSLDGADWKITDELSLPNSEILIAQDLRDDCFFFVSCDRSTSSMSLYTKKAGTNLEKKTWKINFSDTSSNGIKWRTDFSGINKLFEGFNNNTYTYYSSPYIIGQFETYWRIRRDTKPYVRKEYIQIHRNTGYNVTVVLSIPLYSGDLITTIIDHSTNALKEVQSSFNVIKDVNFKPSLGIFKANHASAIIDSIVVISKIVELELINLYFHVFSGKLLHAEVLSYLDISGLKNSFVDVDYYTDEDLNEYASPSRFFELLKLSQPELNVAKVDEIHALISLELLPGSRNPDDILLPIYVDRLKKDKKNRPDLISLGRVINLEDFTVKRGFLPKPFVRDKWLLQMKIFLDNMDKKHTDVEYIKFENKAILAVFFKEAGKLDLYAFY